MRSWKVLLAVWLLVAFTACETTPKRKPVARRTQQIHGVRTTAYTHTESDHLIYGKKNAVGSELRFGKVRSAAADWSVYPVGTIFRIKGLPYVYQVDDYGSALVGTKTIDLYKPSRSMMNQWGVRNVDIEVLRWGSRSQSLKILEPRQKHPHVRQMVNNLRRTTPVAPQRTAR